MNITKKRLPRAIMRVESAIDSTTVESDPGSNIELGTEKPSMWAMAGGINYVPCEHSFSALPPGEYVVQPSDGGPIIQARDSVVDELIKFPESEFDEVMNEINTFWDSEQLYRRFGLLYKRGLLLWGPPGSGKTSLIQIVSRAVIESGGITLFAQSPYWTGRGLKVIRQIEPARRVLVIMEDLDAMIAHGDESQMLALLDGELQVDNVLFLATTNYPERLDKRIINRPSRFDTVKKIGMPSAESRKLYFTKKATMVEESTIDAWVAKTENMSLAHLREIIVSVGCLGRDFDETILRLRKMMECKSSSDEYNYAQDFGFVNK